MLFFITLRDFNIVLHEAEHIMLIVSEVIGNAPRIVLLSKLLQPMCFHFSSVYAGSLYHKCSVSAFNSV